MTELIFGPFFSTAPAEAISCRDVAALPLQLEWASADSAQRVCLFINQRDRAHSTGPLRLEHLLFREHQLPIDLECSSYQTVKTAVGVFLPIEALIAALYRRFDVDRPVCQVLTELVSVVPLDYSPRVPALRDGLLIPSAEAKGFRFHTAVRTGSSLYVEIAWQVPHHATRFHTCLCRFEVNDREVLNEGTWVAPGLVGIAPLLAKELHRVAPGSPKCLFSADSWSRLQPEISIPELKLTGKG